MPVVPSIEVDFRELKASSPLEDYAREQARRLIAPLAEITACRVTIEPIGREAPDGCDATNCGFRFELRQATGATLTRDRE